MLLKPNEYFILLNKNGGRIRITKNYLRAYKLLMQSPKLQIMIIGQNAKTKVINRKEFVAEFGNITGDKDKFFDLVGAVVKGLTNQLAVIAKTPFTGEEYRQYLQDV